MDALTTTIYSTQMAKGSALTPMFQILNSAMSATAPTWSLVDTASPRAARVRCECADCGAHVMVEAARGSSGMCTVCGGFKLFRLHDSRGRE